MNQALPDYEIRFKDGPAAKRDERVITLIEPGRRWFCDMNGTTWWRIDEAPEADPDVAITEYAEVSRSDHPSEPDRTLIYMAVAS